MTCTFSRSTILKFAALPSDSQPCPRHDEKRWILHFSALRASPAVVLARGSSAVLLSPTRSCSPPHSAPLQRQTASLKEQRRRIPPRFDCGVFPVRHPYPLFGQSYMQAITSITLALMMTCSTRNWWWLS